MTSAPRETARYRTQASGVALPTAGLDFGVPILCDIQNFELTNDGVFADTYRSGTGVAFEVELATEKTVLIQATFKVGVTHADNLPYAYSMQGEVDPGPPPGSFGSFQSPRSTSRVTTMEDEGGMLISTTFPWTGVISRPSGLLSMEPRVSISTVGGRVGSHGSILSATAEVFIALVIGTFTDDECLEWAFSS